MWKCIPYSEGEENCLCIIEISLFYVIMDRDERKFVISILSNTRLGTGPTALLQCAFNLVNLLRIAAPCP